MPPLQPRVARTPTPPSGIRPTGAGWVVADRDGPVVCIATSTANASAESTFIEAHMARLPARVRVLSGFEPPLRSDEDVPVTPTVLDRVWPAIARRVLGQKVSTAQDVAVARFLRRIGARAVLAEYGPTGARLLSACRLAKVPLIAHFHGYDASVRSLIEHFGRYRELFEGAAAVIVVSRAMEARLLELGAPPERLHLNCYGVDTTMFGGADPALAPPRFVSAGRFVEKKAPELTLLAFRDARRRVAEATLEMIGDGPLLGPCQRMSQTLGLDDAVTFLGRRPAAEVARHMARARAFLQHSVTARDGDAEGTPLTVLEASATGLPVVATRHGGIPDAVSEGETGFLVDEGDAAAMADHMARLASDPELAGRLGRAGRNRIEQTFTVERSIERLWAIIQAASVR